MKFPIILILFFSINTVADQKVLINGFNFEVKEVVDGNRTRIFYELSDKDRKKLCGSTKGRFHPCMSEKFSNALSSEIFRSSCNSRGLYELQSIYRWTSVEEKVGRVYVCSDLKNLLESKIPNIRVKDLLRNGSKIRINNLVITKLNYSIDGCNYNYLHFSGPVNQDTTEVIRRLLKTTERCTDKNSGEEAPIFIYMSSGGGLLKDGFSIGKLFKENNTNTIVANDATCASSCATAFLGGNRRFMNRNSKLLFHAPYQKQRNQYGKVRINCQTNNQDLENYYIQMIGSEDGDFLYKRTMDFCSASNGWEINEGAARLFGIIE